jgi:myo-inositol-1(or 4)-monophosphatase
VYDPIKEELFTASRGAGAQLNNHRIRVSEHPELKGALLATGFPFRRADRLEQWTKAFTELMGSCADMRRAGSAALDLAYVASGRLDGFWEYDLSPWDLAAGSLLVSEAGGIVDDMQGSGKYLETGHVVAANPRVFRGLFTRLSGTAQ